MVGCFKDGFHKNLTNSIKNRVARVAGKTSPSMVALSHSTVSKKLTIIFLFPLGDNHIAIRFCPLSAPHPCASGRQHEACPCEMLFRAVAKNRIGQRLIKDWPTANTPRSWQSILRADRPHSNGYTPEPCQSKAALLEQPASCFIPVVKRAWHEQDGGTLVKAKKSHAHIIS